MEPVYIFGTLTSIVLALVGFLVKRVYDKVDELEKLTAEHGRTLVKIQTILEN